MILFDSFRSMLQTVAKMFARYFQMVGNNFFCRHQILNKTSLWQETLFETIKIVDVVFAIACKLERILMKKHSPGAYKPSVCKWSLSLNSGIWWCLMFSTLCFWWKWINIFLTKLQMSILLLCLHGTFRNDTLKEDKCYLPYFLHHLVKCCSSAKAKK